MILARIKFYNTIVGCCGSTRNDLIYPIGEELDFDQFKKDCYNTIFYHGKDNQQIYKDDVYYLEYYETKDPEDWRGLTPSLLEFMKSQDGIWSFRENGVVKFTVKTPEELKEKWK